MVNGKDAPAKYRPPRRSRSRSPLHRKKNVGKNLKNNIKKLGKRNKLSDCLKNLEDVCLSLLRAVKDALDYADIVSKLPENETNSAQSSPSECIYNVTKPIFEGLNSLYMLSKTSRGKNLEERAGILEIIWSNREKLFTVQDRIKLENWRSENRNFASLFIASSADRFSNGKGSRYIPPPVVSNGFPKSQNSDMHQGDLLSQNPVSEDHIVWNGVTVCRQMYNLIKKNKLCLILDLDHTLLQSALPQDIPGHLVGLLNQCVHEEARKVSNDRTLYFLPQINMFTKLRPGVHQLLYNMSNLFELYIYTNGNQAYAEAVIPLIDPSGYYFNNMRRVFAAGAEKASDMISNAPKSLDRFKEYEPIAVLVDDTQSVWRDHSSQLIAVTRYMYFPLPQTSGPSWLEHKGDEAAPGMLAATENVLRRIHTAVFGAAEVFKEGSARDGALVSWDVRVVLPRLRRKVLQGVFITFSRIIPLGEDPTMHPLWQLAESFGAKCTPHYDRNFTTHVVSTDLTTQKALDGIRDGKAVVGIRWLEDSCFLWQRANESQYMLKQ